MYIWVFPSADVSLIQLRSAVSVLHKMVQVCTRVHVWFFLCSSEHKMGVCLAEEFPVQGL